MAVAIDLKHIQRGLELGSGATSDFDLNPNAERFASSQLKVAGVLVPFIERDSGLHLILTKRASHLKHHPGQIAFPGGRMDADDVDVTATALREAHEEIGLLPENVEVIGNLPSHETVSRYAMTPIIGRVKGDFYAICEPGEVAEVFEVPAHFVLDPDKFRVESRLWRGAIRSYYTVPYGPYYIWGATARVLKGLAERVSK
ncbi:CoA pyrophosphatase [Celeribacter marinus]|uniref:CoA pyrophosphatase n=1 Tax=Celeribacter marinus TaxID=1397108 RepID=UPI003F6CC25F